MSTELKSLKGKKWNQESSEMKTLKFIDKFSGGKEGMKLINNEK